MTICI